MGDARRPGSKIRPHNKVVELSPEYQSCLLKYVFGVGMMLHEGVYEIE